MQTDQFRPTAVLVRVQKKPSTLTSKVLGSDDPIDSFSPDHSPSRAFPSTSPLPRGDVLLRQAAFRRAVLE
jgi:hypothetical protein